MKNYSVFVGFSGMEAQEDFQGSFDACKGYALAVLRSGEDVTTLHIVELSPEHYWAEDLAEMLDQELKPSIVQGCGYMEFVFVIV